MDRNEPPKIANSNRKELKNEGTSFQSSVFDLPSDYSSVYDVYIFKVNDPAHFIHNSKDHTIELPGDVDNVWILYY